MTKQPLWLPSTHGGKIFNHFDSAHHKHTGNFGRLVPKGCYAVPFEFVVFFGKGLSYTTHRRTTSEVLGNYSGFHFPCLFGCFANGALPKP